MNVEINVEMNDENKNGTYRSDKYPVIGKMAKRATLSSVPTNANL